MRRISARINREIRLQAQLHGLQLEETAETAAEEKSVPLTDDAKAAMDKRLKEIQEKIASARPHNKN